MVLIALPGESPSNHLYIHFFSASNGNEVVKYKSAAELALPHCQ